jgi:hypothetical protein
MRQLSQETEMVRLPRRSVLNGLRSAFAGWAVRNGTLTADLEINSALHGAEFYIFNHSGCLQAQILCEQRLNANAHENDLRSTPPRGHLEGPVSHLTAYPLGSTKTADCDSWVPHETSKDLVLPCEESGANSRCGVVMQTIYNFFYGKEIDYVYE